MPVVPIDEHTIRAGYEAVIMGYLRSTGRVVRKDAESEIHEYILTLDITSPVRKATTRKNRSPEEIAEAKRLKLEKQQERAAKRLAVKEAKDKAKAEAKAAKKAEREAKKAEREAKKAADKAEWFTNKRLTNPNGGDDPRGHNGSYVRYKLHRTSGEMRLVNPKNWTDENKQLLKVFLAAEKAKKAAKASKPDMMKAVKAVAKKQVKPKKAKLTAAERSEKKAALKKQAAEAKKAKKAKAEAEAKAKAEAEAKAKAEAAAANSVGGGESKSSNTGEFVNPEDDDFTEMEAESFDESFDEIDEDALSRTPFTWDKQPDMELWEDEDRWCWDGTGDEANPVCYYDEDEGEYVMAPGCEELIA